MNGLSQRIVDYIAELTPLYTFQFADGCDCALSLSDGTLMMPVDESSTAREEGWVAVLWQGDAQRRSEVPGPLLAYQAALRCAELHGIGRLPAEVAARRHLLLTRLGDICGDLLHIEAAVQF
ncbi:hypothetical protein [Dyella acidiphila]|uniref:DUF3168 domain-containing protein n=1 Tax=Dyella acidiphila TaxID=2775866 RepID=A0ABR9G5W8_9GAMM|nr:hypothetical protein [Dyella acidiphila]MBE1159425.1 hypothetical protein [Dyella acidiphila]